MNLLILEEHQQLPNNAARPSAKQAEHIRKVLKLKDGSRIGLGQLGGKIGHGRVQIDDEDNITLVDIALNNPAPSMLPVTLILAMPRPQMLKRIMQTVATMGVEKLCLLQTGKVEKSFWQSPSATPEAIREHLLLGLEQGIATTLPEIEYYRRFRPFAEDQLPSIAKNSTKLIAHPGVQQHSIASNGDEHVTLAIGPEGGFTSHEFEYFLEAGFKGISLGERILKVETAVPVALAKLFN